MASYILANNAKAELAESITDSNTGIMLTEISDTLSDALENVVDGQMHILLTVANITDEIHEIVEVVDWDSGTATATILRGRDGTESLEWPANTVLELRVTRYLLQSLFSGFADNTIAILGVALGMGAVAIGQGAFSSGPASLALGQGANAQADNAVVIGNGYVGADRGIAIGDFSNAADEDGIAIGDSSAGGPRVIAIGLGAGSWEPDAICVRGEGYAPDTIVVGVNSAAHAQGGIALGREAASQGERAITIGDQAKGYFGDFGIIIGAGTEMASIAGVSLGAKTQNYANFGVVLGYQAMATSPHFSHLAMIPGQPAANALPGDLHEDDLASRHRAAPVMTLATGVIDLTDDQDHAEIEIPTGAEFYIDRIDLIVTSATDPAGPFEIQVGTGDGPDVDNILTSSAVTVDQAQQRQMFTPEINGVDSIRVSVATAGTGNLNCRVIIIGYLMAGE
ncbi:hypothetical protein [Desulfonatronovibrio hydrogenovorans]|uniref:hypothetical protein n=1 Tax=Desulfonatronovibrio hydrogenovorans TaxID=53245 RepID=UPI00048C5393|nr:hypothetical protein [Desulfonatronovibrio hydrogenovorans]